MTESTNIYKDKNSNNQEQKQSLKVQRILERKNNRTEEEKLLNRSRCSYAKYLTWCSKKNKTPEYNSFEEYEERVCKPLYKEENEIKLLETDRLDLKKWLSLDTDLKIRKINANKKYDIIKRKITDLTSFYSDIQIKDRVYCILNDITERKLCKCGCGKYTKSPRHNFLDYHYSKDEDVKRKRRENYKLKTGYENPSQNPEIKKKKKETCYLHFGTENPMEIPEKRKQISESNKITQNRPEVKQKIRQTTFDRYGCEHYTQTEEYKNMYNDKEFVKSKNEKMFNSKKENGTLNSSDTEDQLFEILLTKFPKAIHHYKTKEYPFACDFYIPELDLYIEYQGTWTHGEKEFHLPFNENNLEHLKKKDELLEKSSYSKYYKTAIYVWTKLDPEKRKIAKENNLNWIEFFNEKEFMKWFESI